MKTTDTNNAEKYISPEMEILQFSTQSRILQTSGGDDSTEPTNPGEHHDW